SGVTYDRWHVITMLLERFIFVFAITIPFDIRDMRSDEEAGLQTIPIIIGEKRAMILANIYIFLFLVICFFHYFNTNLAFTLPAFFISAITTFLFINNKRIQNTNYYHYFVLDGTMLLQGLLVCLCYYILAH
ncbi:MAG: UbiA family prenyltransferase, partial [Bacteroidia bacterium]